MHVPPGCPRHQMWLLLHGSSVIHPGQFAWPSKKSFLCLSQWVNSVVEIGRTLLSGDKPRGHFGLWGSCCRDAKPQLWREESTAAQEIAQLEKDAKKCDSLGTGQASEEHEQLARGPSVNLLASCETSWLWDSQELTFPSSAVTSTVCSPSILQFWLGKWSAWGSTWPLPLFGPGERRVYPVETRESFHTVCSIINGLKHHLIPEFLPGCFPLLLLLSSLCTHRILYVSLVSLCITLICKMYTFLWLSHLDF